MSERNQNAEAPGQQRMATLRLLLANLDEMEFPATATPDRESYMRYGDDSYGPADLVVTSGTRRVLIKVAWGAREVADLMEPANLAELQRLLERVPQADAAVSVYPKGPDFPAVIVDGFGLANAVQPPEGTPRSTPEASDPEPLRAVLRKDLDPRESWADLPPAASLSFEKIAPSEGELAAVLEEAVTELRQRGSRAKTREKSDALTDLSEKDVSWIGDLVRAAITGEADPDAIASLLEKRSRVRPTNPPKVRP